MKSFRNVYEESPEKLKDLLKNAGDYKGQRPRSRLSRSTLLSTHERHLKHLSEGPLPIRTVILPPPYPPSRVSLGSEECQKMHLNDLRYDIRDPATVVIVKAISKPYIHSSTILIVEDESGHVARLSLGNLEDTVLDPIVSESDILAIRQPCWSRLVDGGIALRVDHPSDFEKLKADDLLVPAAWRTEAAVSEEKSVKEWKTAGDMLFLKKRFRAALECYQNGLRSNDVPRETAVDLWRKLCGVDIVLLRLDKAGHDLAMAVSSLPNASETTSPFRDPAAFEAWLHNGSTEDKVTADALNIPRPLLELASRIKFDLGVYQDQPNYNFPVMASYVGPLSLHLDCPNYIADTVVKQTERHGRGLYARRDFKRGELIMVEKAFVLPGYFMADRSSDCLLYNLANETASPRPGALLFKELVQKLRHNPSCRRAFFELDAGDFPPMDFAENGGVSGEDIPVDVFRIESIRQRNCFSVPLRSLDLLNKPPNSNPEMRNGFWIHSSYINHSCLPNTVRTFIGDIHIVRATRDISAGEEITHQYVSPEVDPRGHQEKLQGTWGFECDCRLCGVEEAVPLAEREKRQELFNQLRAAVMKIGTANPPTVTAIKKVGKMTRALEALYDAHNGTYATLPRLALVHPTLWLVEAWRGVKNMDRMIEYAIKLLRNFGIIVKAEDKRFEIISETGLVNVEVVRTLKYLTEAYKSKGETGLAEQAMNLAKVWFVCITGCEVGMEEFLGN